MVLENGEIGEVVGGWWQGHDKRVFIVGHYDDVILLECRNSIGKKTGGDAGQGRERRGREPHSLDAGRATRAHDMTSLIARYLEGRDYENAHYCTYYSVQNRYANDPYT